MPSTICRFRRPHPRYREAVPAYETAKHSLLLMRGCVDGCTCCSITEHAGRITQSRSADSILRELRSLRRQMTFTVWSAISVARRPPVHDALHRRGH